MKNAWDKYYNKGSRKKLLSTIKNADLIRLDARNKYRNVSEKDKNKKTKYQRERYHMNSDLNERLKQYRKNYYASKKIKKIICFYSIKMSKQTLKVGNIVADKIEFHASKQAIVSNLEHTKKIVVSDKFKHRADGSKYFIGYLHDDDVTKPLCIILPHMSGYIKYFDNGEKNISLKIEDESVYLKYTEIWNKIKNSQNTSFHSQLIYDDKYIKTKVKTFSSMINTLFRQ